MRLEEMTPVATGLLGWLFETMLVASAFAALAYLAGRVRWLAAGPAARHAFWILVLIKLVTPPLIHWPWSLPLPTMGTAVEETPPAFERIVLDVEVLESTPSDDSVNAATFVRTGLGFDWSSVPWPVWVFSAWLAGSISLGLLQAIRLIRFGQRLKEGESAPAWLVEEAESVGLRLGVRVPSIRVVPRLSTPLVWCLGQPVLLVPLDLIKTLEADRWRAIVAHELAHLRRGDHWVRRLELVAGLAWWWCPLYWWVCRNLDFEAELACDAWAVWESPRDRLTYAESLIQIGTDFSLVDSPRPALGVIGSGRSFERRLTMILNERIERRVSAASLVLAILLGLLAVPSWTLASPVTAQDPKPSAETSKLEVVVFDTDDDDDDDENDDDKKKDSKAKKPAKKKIVEDSADKKKREAIEIEIQSKFGPESEFAKKMEALSKEIEAKFGPNSDFVKQMEAFGKEMEAKFGDGSQFTKDIEKAVKEKIEADGKKAKVRFEARVKADKGTEKKGEIDKAQKRIGEAKAGDDKAKRELDAIAGSLARLKSVKRDVEAKAGDDKAKRELDVALGKLSRDLSREKRIQAIQASIDKLHRELKSLKDAADKDDDEDKK